jgi:2-amino-4-hydroxy-6-hydroxymethyldihydropteridine diphosphokinase
MTEVYLALGSNVGDSPALFKQAMSLLAKDVLTDIKQAPIYITKPVGYTDQPNFLNTVISGQTDLAPGELLTRVKQLEHEIGRIKRFHWGPREIDIDIIFYGGLLLETPDLVIPHPRLYERDFVLAPLHDLNPDLLDPSSGQTVSQLLANLQADQTSIIKQVDETS